MADPEIIEAPGQMAGRQVAGAGGTAAAGRASGGALDAAARAAPAHRGRAGWAPGGRAPPRWSLGLGDWYIFIQQIAQFTVQPVEAGTQEKQ